MSASLLEKPGKEEGWSSAVGVGCDTRWSHYGARAGRGFPRLLVLECPYTSTASYLDPQLPGAGFPP